MPTITVCSGEYIYIYISWQVSCFRLQCFLTPTVVGRQRPILLEICAQSDPPPPVERNDLDQYLLIVDTMLHGGLAAGRWPCD